MKVYFYPPISKNNLYIKNIVDSLSFNNIEVINKSSGKKSNIFNLIKSLIKKVKIYHFNWIENFSTLDTIKNRIICKSILILFDIIKISGGRIIWTMHNKESHFSKNNNSFHYNYLKKFISKMDGIIIHCQSSKKILIEKYNYPEDRITYIPIGNYLEKNTQSPRYKNRKNFSLLSFGLIYDYKNIPMLIEAFSELNLKSSELKIYGKCDIKDPNLKIRINESIGDNNNISYEDRFVPEEELNDILEKSTIVIMPYKKASMLNSGVAIKAFSSGRPILSSAFEGIKDLEDKCFVHSYDYEKESSHKEKLKQEIINIYNLWEKDKDIFIREGKEAFKYAKDDLSWEKIGKDLTEFYQKIANIPKKNGHFFY